jgi:hypothetical protein
MVQGIKLAPPIIVKSGAVLTFPPHAFMAGATLIILMWGRVKIMKIPIL